MRKAMMIAVAAALVGGPFAVLASGTAAANLPEDHLTYQQCQHQKILADHNGQPNMACYEQPDGYYQLEPYHG